MGEICSSTEVIVVWLGVDDVGLADVQWLYSEFLDKVNCRWSVSDAYLAEAHSLIWVFPLWSDGTRSGPRKATSARYVYGSAGYGVC